MPRRFATIIFAALLGLAALPLFAAGKNLFGSYLPLAISALPPTATPIRTEVTHRNARSD